MIFGPVLPVELVTSSRRARYFVVRTIYAAALLVTLWVEYEEIFGGGMTISNQQRVTMFAAVFFRSFAIVQLLAVLVLTPPMVAGTIAEEKDRKTIEYLFVTDLSNVELVLGKLAARLLHLLGHIAVGLPVLALTMLLGGVGFEGLLLAFGITLATLFTVAAVSIWASVQARRARDAVSRVLLLGLAVLLLPPIASVIPWSSTGVEFVDDAIAATISVLLAANPFVCLVRALGPGPSAWSALGELVRNQSVVAVPCAVWAVWRVRAVYLRQTYGKAAKRRAALSFRLWRPQQGDSPMIWKELFAERAAGQLGIVGAVAQVGLLLVVLIPTLWVFSQVSANRNTGLWTKESFRYFVVVLGTAVACLGLLIVAVRAATCVTSERERQTWEVLLSTPLDASEIVWGKLLGSLYAGRAVVVLLVVLWVLGLAAGSLMPIMVPIVATEIVILAFCTSLMGLLWSLRFKGSIGSMAATLGTAVFVGGGYLFCCVPLMRGPDSGIMMAGLVPFLLGFPLAADPAAPALTVRGDADFVAACVIGMLMYFLATLVMFGVAVSSFDGLAGRVSGGLLGLVTGTPRTFPPARSAEVTDDGARADTAPAARRVAEDRPATEQV